ncbi:hypothetical protein EMIT0P265_230010 [Pseudomonas zeae]
MCCQYPGTGKYSPRLKQYDPPNCCHLIISNQEFRNGRRNWLSRSSHSHMLRRLRRYRETASQNGPPSLGTAVKIPLALLQRPKMGLEMIGRNDNFPTPTLSGHRSSWA